MSQLIAYPGTYLLLKSKAPLTVNLGNIHPHHIIHGVVVDVGKPRIHDSGGKLEPFCEVGDTVFFINYGSEEKYEEFEWEGKTYYSVIMNDARAFIKGEK